MRGAAVGIEPRRVGVGAEREVVDGGEAEPFQPRHDVARQVEHEMAGLARREEARVVRVGRHELLHQLGADLVARLVDHRPGRRDDARARSAEPLHLDDGCLQHAAERAAPAGVRRADHLRLRVGEQHRSAIRGRDADRQCLLARHDGVGMRPRLVAPRLARLDHLGRMDLVAGQQPLRPDRERLRHARAVLVDVGAQVLRADAAVQRGIDAVRNAAVAGEEAVADAGQRGERGRLQGLGVRHVSG